MAIKTNELCVGNYLLFEEDDAEFMVENIGLHDNGIIVSNKRETTWIELDAFVGIPLTEEWLLKLGFVKTKNRENIFDKGRMSIYFGNNSIAYFMNEELTEAHYIGIKKHVHEIQNLYFALTGEELVIIK